MTKIFEGLFGKGPVEKKALESSIKRKGSMKPVCYVLVTCSEPDENGSMDVEVKYEGERDLAAYLLNSAQDILEGESDGSV